MPRNTEQRFMHDLTIDKVAFVDSPANEREFLIFKSKNIDDKETSSMNEALKKQLAEEGLSDDEIGEIEKATADGPWWKRFLSKEKTEDELKKEAADKKEAEDKELATKKAAEDKEEAITKAASALIATELADLRKSAEDAVKREVVLKEEISKEREIRKSAEYITKAAGYTAVPLAKSELATFMRFVEEGDPAQFAVLEKMLNTVQAVFMKSSAFLADSVLGIDETVGADGASKLEKMVDEMIEKSTTEITRDAAMAKVIQKHPELYEEHRSQFIAGPSAAEQSK